MLMVEMPGSNSEPTFTDQLRAFRAEIVRRTAFALILVTGTSSWLILSLNPFPFWLFLILVAILGLSASVYHLSIEHQTTSRILLSIVSLLGPIALMFISTEQWMPFIVLPFVFIGSIVINRGEWLVGGAIAVTTIFLTLIGWRDYPLSGFVVSLTLAIALSWVVIYMVSTSLRWYQSMLDQSNRLLHETREHRGELSKTVKALKLATDLQRRTEHELIKARHIAEEARLMKERFAARVSHELRTPMALIHGFSEVMYNTPEIYGDVTWTPTMRRDIAQIYRNSRHMLSMMDDILNLSQFELSGFSINLEDTSMGNLIEEAAAIAQNLFNNPNVHFEVEITPDLPVLKVDRTRIRQVILNLVNNARRFTEKGWVRLGVKQTQHEVIICVSDTGPGIPPEKLDLIFQEFYQVDDTFLRNKGGTGLGLTICKNFVEIHGGNIWVESTVGKGSTFFFSLPRLTPFTQSSLQDSVEVGETNRDLPRLIVHGADEYVHAMLRASLINYEIILVPKVEMLEDAVLFYHPHAVLINSMPDTTEEIIEKLNITIPLVHFSIPSTQWLVDRLELQSCLTKPITGDQIQRELARLRAIEKILVIDDDPEFTQLIERLLQSHNPDLLIFTSNSGQTGLNLAFGKKPDLIFLDLNMPDMDGISLIEQIRNNQQTAIIPIILVSANPYTEQIMSLSDNRVFISRPGELHMAETVKLVKSALDVLRPNYSESTDDILIKLKI